jgi:sortase A
VPRPPLSRGASAAVWITTAISLLAIWAVFFALALTDLQAARSQQVLYETLREQLANAEVKVGGPDVAPGSPIALLEVPSIDARYVVVEGTSSGDLRLGPGHVRTTPFPGQSGTCVLYGRSVTFGAPFRHITELHPGDTITITTGQGTFDYRVDGVRRSGDPLPRQLRTGEGGLTLITADSANWRDGWAPDRVAYVDASLQGPSQPSPTGRPRLLLPQEGPMRGDLNALVPLVLWLQVLLFGVGAFAWSQVRWGAPQAWLVCVPIIMMALWGASESALLLLPNLV